jgi:hypothetical protein
MVSVDTGIDPGKSKGASIPKIKLASGAGIESVFWGLVIAHLVKWAVSFGYFASWQLKYPGPLYGDAHPYLLWYGKDWWDRLVIHVQNGLPGEIAVTCGIIVAVALALAGVRLARSRWLKALVLLSDLCAGAAMAIFVLHALAGWHVRWFPTQDEPAWWVTWRHDIRDVGIALIATIIVRLMFSKPKYGADDNPGPRVYLTRIPLSIGAALVPVAVLGVVAWKLPWLTQHGWHVPSRYEPWAGEANGWFSAGLWVTSVMGIAGGLVATKVIQRVADDIQWFWAERGAAKLRAEGFLSTGRVLGTPAHRLRVHWLLDHKPELPVRSPWLVRILLFIAFVSILFSGAGAWLNLVGPAAN